MNARHIFPTLMTALFLWSPAQAETELVRLRTLVAEQERQIRMLEEENAQLKADAMPRGGRSLNPGRTNLVTAPSQPAPVVAPRTTASAGYTVLAGDNLVRIGRKLGVTAEALARANGLTNESIIHPGQKLKVPDTDRADPAAIPSPPPVVDSAARTHTVVAGDTYYSISRTHGVAVERLMALNSETPASALRVGQKIRLPEKSGSQAVPVSAGTAAAPHVPAPATRPAEGDRKAVRTIMIDGEMSYGAFAAKHGTTPERLNQLNGLDLDGRTVLAKGSELYVPAQP